MHNPHYVKYNYAQTQYLVARWVAGATAAQVGAELGISRNAVVGWLFRNPLRPEQQALRVAAVQRVRPPPTDAQRQQARRLRQARYATGKPKLPPKPKPKLTPTFVLSKPPPLSDKQALRRQFEEAWKNTAALAVGHGHHPL
jgi:hypothetical protein